MITTRCLTVAYMAVLLIALFGEAGIPEPPATLYGTLTVDGQPVAATSSVTIMAKVTGTSNNVGSYSMGDNVGATGQCGNGTDCYVLRIKLESTANGVLPRSDDAALVGETVEFSIVLDDGVTEVEAIPASGVAFTINSRGQITQLDLVASSNVPPSVAWSVPVDNAIHYLGCGVTEVSIGFSEDVRGSGGSQISAQDFAVNGSSAVISNFSYDGTSHVVSFTIPELAGVSWHTIKVNGDIEDTEGKKLAGNVTGAAPGLNHHWIDVGVLRGDFQQDHDVDVFDRTQFLASWTTQNGSTGTDLEADYQCDSDVDVFDRTQFLANWTVANGQDIGAPPSH